MPPSRILNSDFEFDSTPPRPHSPSLSDFGDSTGLFDAQSGNSEGFYPNGYKADQAPIPLKLSAKSATKTTKDTQKSKTTKMVNERSAPRAPPAGSAMPAPANTANASRPLDRERREHENNYAMSPPTQAPQFGRATMPQSPLSKGNGYLDQRDREYRQSQNQGQGHGHNQNQSRPKDSSMFIPSKPRQPNFQPSQQQQPRHPHMHAAKEFVKNHIPGQSNPQSKPVPIGVPIARPQAPVYTTTKAAPSTSYGSFGNKYENTGSFANGFKPVNQYKAPAPPAAQGAYKNPIVVDQYQPKLKPLGPGGNVVDLTTNTNQYSGTQYNYDRSAGGIGGGDPYTFVDPKKAADDLKALLEGAIEDEDDKPIKKTRRIKKKKESGLSTMFKSLKVQAEEPEKEADKEAEEESEEDEDDGTVEGIKVKLLPHQVEGLSWMRDREVGTKKKGLVPKGGILADDMGLGKTLQSVSLIITNPRPSGSDLVDGKRKFPAEMGKGTLVVAPLALIRQWEAEIKDKVAISHALRVIVHHGPSRTKNFNDLKKYDVVITTYQILVSEWGNSSESYEDGSIQVGCFGIHWYRVILDEAHTIKNRNAKATQACYALRSEYRWCLTGTPMQNNLDELQSLIKFLRIKPYDDLKTWKDQIDRPMKNGRGDVAIKRLQHYLKIFMKRRTKEILKKEGALNPGGKALAEGEVSKTGFKVTERRIAKVFAEFSPEERLFYERLEKRTDKSLKNMMDGANVNYASALVLLLRLRQACNHPKLCASSLGKDGEALGAEAATVPSTPRKSKGEEDVDDLADMLGQVTVGNKKCDICQLPLPRELAKAGALRCEECEADLIMSARKPISKKLASKNRINALRERHAESPKPKSRTPPQQKQRKPRNRNVILDSDDEEGSWVVSGDEQGPLRLGKAGGTTDEDAEGTGEEINSSDDDSRDSQDGYESEGSFVANTTSDSIRSTRSSKAQSKSDKKGRQVITIDSDSDSDASQASDNESIVEIEESSDDDLPLNPATPHHKSGSHHKMAEIITSTKITHLLSILGKEADEHKFIVFSQFTSMLDLIEPFLQRDGYKYTRYDGSMRNDLREASLKMLREEKSCRILLCSLKCGSLGLNLTAATRVVILEPFWNPFVEEQAIDRVHRLTQKTDVIVYKITIKDSVEERILELQEKKRELANQAIEGGNKQGGVGKLGMQEIMQLFSRKAELEPPKLGDATSYTRGGGEGVLGRREESREYSRESSVEYGRGSRESTGSIQSSRQGSAGAVKVKKWRSGKVTEHPVYGRR